MDWQFCEDIAIYIQIKDIIKNEILTSSFHPGEMLLPVDEISKRSSVNPNTVEKGIKELEKTGLIYRDKDFNIFVTEDIELIQDFKNDSAISECDKFILKIKKLNLSRETVRKILDSIGEALDE